MKKHGEIMKRLDLVSPIPRLYVKNQNKEHQNCATAFVNEHYAKNNIFLTRFCEKKIFGVDSIS